MTEILAMVKRMATVPVRGQVSARLLYDTFNMVSTGWRQSLDLAIEWQVGLELVFPKRGMYTNAQEMGDDLQAAAEKVLSLMDRDRRVRDVLRQARVRSLDEYFGGQAVVLSFVRGYPKRLVNPNEYLIVYDKLEGQRVPLITG